MSKFLKVSFPEKCIGCELCLAEAQRQLGKVGLEGSLIRVLKTDKSNGKRNLEFAIQLDPGVNKLNLQKIRSICPTEVFTIEEQEEDNGLVG